MTDKTNAERLRIAVLVRDGYVCQYCGAPLTPGVDAEVDHIVPRCLGGENEPTNLVAVCPACNAKKNSKMLPDDEIQRLRLLAAGRDLPDLSEVHTDRRSFRADDVTWDRAKDLAWKRRVSVSELIRSLIDQLWRDDVQGSARHVRQERTP